MIQNVFLVHKHSYMLTLSAHVREGYSSDFVCLCVTFLFWRRLHFSVETYQHNLGDNLNVAFFLKIEAILEKKQVGLRPKLQ